MNIFNQIIFSDMQHLQLKEAGSTIFHSYITINVIGVTDCGIISLCKYKSASWSKLTDSIVG